MIFTFFRSCYRFAASKNADISKRTRSFMCWYSEWHPPNERSLFPPTVLTEWNRLGEKFYAPVIVGFIHEFCSRSSNQRSCKSELLHSPPSTTMNF